MGAGAEAAWQLEFAVSCGATFSKSTHSVEAVGRSSDASEPLRWRQMLIQEAKLVAVTIQHPPC